METLKSFLKLEATRNVVIIGEKVRQYYLPEIEEIFDDYSKKEIKDIVKNIKCKNYAKFGKNLVLSTGQIVESPKTIGFTIVEYVPTEIEFVEEPVFHRYMDNGIFINKDFFIHKNGLILAKDVFIKGVI